MVVELSLILVIVLVISAVLGIQIAEESVLAMWIKNFLGLQQPYSPKLLALGKPNMWWSLYRKSWLGLLFIPTMPVVTVFVILLGLHRFISNVLICNKCTATWIAAILLYFVAGLTIWESLLCAPLTIVVVYILDRIR